jgi:TPR repeat protein
VGRKKLATKDNILKLSINQEKSYDEAVDAYFSGDCLFAFNEAVSLINQNFDRANLLLGYIYESGCKEVPRNMEHAFFYYKQAAEKVGVIEAWLRLGRMYFYGDGVAQNYHEAYECYKWVNSNRDNNIAKLMLARMYHMGLGVETNFELALDFYRSAAMTGNVYAIKNWGLLEQQKGNILKGLALRVKAVVMSFLIAYKDINDSRLQAN